MILVSIEDPWVSRLRTDDFADDMGFEPIDGNEIPHVNGLPVRLPMRAGATVVREWPNIAGRLEPGQDSDVVRWCRSLAPEPQQGRVMARGVVVDEGHLDEMRRWLTKFARALTQIPGVALTTPTDTPRVVLLTPRGVASRSDLPNGIDPITPRLAEFPGGVVLTMDEQSFESRAEYADAVESILREV